MKKSTLQEALRARFLTEETVEDSAEKVAKEVTKNDPKIDAEKVADDVENIADKLEIDPDEIYNANGDIERNLERALKIARREKANNGKEWQDLCLVGDAGIGKAQPLTSKIYGIDGYKLMGEIKPGDIILDGEGVETSVLNVYPQGNRQIYKIYFDDNTFIEVADNHLNSVYRHWPITNPINQGDEDLILETKDLFDLVNSKGKKKYKGQYNPTLYVKIPKISGWKDSEKITIDPYLLGCLLGDGSISPSSGLGFTSMDDEIIENLNAILRKDWNLELSNHGGNSYNICNVNHSAKRNASERREFEKALADLGVRKCSAEKFIPEAYKYASIDTRLALIQGLMDTDGTVSRPKVSKFSNKLVGGKCSFTSVSKQLAEDVAFVLRSLGCKASIFEGKNNPTYKYKYKGVEEIRNCKKAYSVYINKPDDISLFRLTRKANMQINGRFTPRRAIEKVVLDRIDSCQCIYVESSCHTYLTDNLTVTHNTSRFWTWTHQHPEINVLYYDAKTMDELDFKGKYINKENPEDVKYSAVRSDEFDLLDNGECILFLDEFNRAKANIRGTMLTLICDHKVPDPRFKGGRPLKGLLFTVVAVNPFNGAYNIKDEFDAAEKSRWKNVQVTQTPRQFREYVLRAIEKRLQVEKDEEERKAWTFRHQLADKLLSDSRFHFDTPEEIEANSLSEDNVTNPRSVKRALYSSYDLEDFYDNFAGHCNPQKLPTVKAILGNFQVNDDRANQILNTYNTRSQEIFRD